MFYKDFNKTDRIEPEEKKISESSKTEGEEFTKRAGRNS